MGIPRHGLGEGTALCDAIQHHRVEWLDTPHSGHAHVSRFVGSNGSGEWHLTTSVNAGQAQPLEALETAWLEALAAQGLSPQSTVMRRVFCDDPTVGRAAWEGFAKRYPGAFSCIGQPPIGATPAIWSQHLTSADQQTQGSGDGCHFILQRGALRHHWLCGLTRSDANEQDTAAQTTGILEHHDNELSRHGMELAHHVVRTWWYVRDIDRQYRGLVDARRRHFEAHGLNSRTHYIASTGIAGSHADAQVQVSMDSYAIEGLLDKQVEYLSAPDHLGRTDDYGVTFERATAVSYAERRHIFISGTASIDPSGNIVHPGQVLPQLERALDNIEALLSAAGAGLDDLTVMLAYLRNPGDGPAVRAALLRRFPGLPMLVLHAPVCRPGWLVEVEGLAITHAAFKNLPDF